MKFENQQIEISSLFAATILKHRLQHLVIPYVASKLGVKQIAEIKEYMREQYKSDASVRVTLSKVRKANLFKEGKTTFTMNREKDWIYEINSTDLEGYSEQLLKAFRQSVTISTEDLLGDYKTATITRNLLSIIFVSTSEYTKSKNYLAYSQEKIANYLNYSRVQINKIMKGKLSTYKAIATKNENHIVIHDVLNPAFQKDAIKAQNKKQTPVKIMKAGSLAIRRTNSYKSDKMIVTKLDKKEIKGDVLVQRNKASYKKYENKRRTLSSKEANEVKKVIKNIIKDNPKTKKIFADRVKMRLRKEDKGNFKQLVGQESKLNSKVLIQLSHATVHGYNILRKKDSVTHVNNAATINGYILLNRAGFSLKGDTVKVNIDNVLKAQLALNKSYYEDKERREQKRLVRTNEGTIRLGVNPSWYRDLSLEREFKFVGARKEVIDRFGYYGVRVAQNYYLNDNELSPKFNMFLCKRAIEQEIENTGKKVVWVKPKNKNYYSDFINANAQNIGDILIDYKPKQLTEKQDKYLDRMAMKHLNETTQNILNNYTGYETKAEFTERLNKQELEDYNNRMSKEIAKKFPGLSF